MCIPVNDLIEPKDWTVKGDAEISFTFIIILRMTYLYRTPDSSNSTVRLYSE